MMRKHNKQLKFTSLSAKGDQEKYLGPSTSRRVKEKPTVRDPEAEEQLNQSRGSMSRRERARGEQRGREVPYGGESLKKTNMEEKTANELAEPIGTLGWIHVLTRSRSLTPLKEILGRGETAPHIY